MQAEIDYDLAKKAVERQKKKLDKLEGEVEDAKAQVTDKKHEIEQLDDTLKDEDYPDELRTPEGAEAAIKKFERLDTKAIDSNIRPPRPLNVHEEGHCEGILAPGGFAELVSTDYEDVAQAISRLLPPSAHDAIIMDKSWSEIEGSGLCDGLQKERSLFCLHRSGAMPCENMTGRALLEFQGEDEKEKTCLEGFGHDYLGRAVNLLYITKNSSTARKKIRQQLLYPLLRGAHVFVTRKALVEYHERMLSDNLIAPRTICLEDFSESPAHWGKKVTAHTCVSLKKRVQISTAASSSSNSSAKFLDKRARQLYEARNLHRTRIGLCIELTELREELDKRDGVVTLAEEELQRLEDILDALKQKLDEIEEAQGNNSNKRKRDESDDDDDIPGKSSASGKRGTKRKSHLNKSSSKKKKGGGKKKRSRYC